MNNLVSIIIIGFNSEPLLTKCFDSLKKQTHKPLEIIFIDNNSSDNSVKLVSEKYPEVMVIANHDNLGFAAACNQAIKISKGDYVMPTNPDILLEPNFIEQCVKRLEKDEKIGVIGGKTYKYDFQKDEKTDLIDTVGLFIYPNRRVIDDGQGLKDEGQFDQETEVFGVSGACPMYRRSALEDIKVYNDYYDSDFFMYKEDIDICWRLLLYGWKCLYYPQAIAYHGRGTGVFKRFSNLEVIKNRSKNSPFQKTFSFRNQRLMQIKNEFITHVILDFPVLFIKEILTIGYMLIKEPKILAKSTWQMIKLIPKTVKKRKYIMKHKRVTSKEMRHWFKQQKSKYLIHS